MNVILQTPDFERFNFILPRDATEKRPESFGKRRCDEWTSLLRAEDAMEIGTDVGHAIIQPSLRDWRNMKLVTRR